MILSSAASRFEKYIEITITRISPIIRVGARLLCCDYFIFFFFLEYIIDSEVYLPPALTI